MKLQYHALENFVSILLLRRERGENILDRRGDNGEQSVRPILFSMYHFHISPRVFKKLIWNFCQLLLIVNMFRFFFYYSYCCVLNQFKQYIMKNIHWLRYLYGNVEVKRCTLTHCAPWFCIDWRCILGLLQINTHCVGQFEYRFNTEIVVNIIQNLNCV